MSTLDVTRFPGVYSRPDSKVYQFGLKPPDDLRRHFAGDWVIRCSLRTSNLTEANDKAKALHAEWALKFAVLRRSDNPVTVVLTPALAASIAAELRRWMLEADDNMRAFPEGPDGLLAMERRRHMEAAAGVAQCLTIVRPSATMAQPQDEPRDPLAGLSEQQLDAVTRFNARAEAEAVKLVVA